MTSPHKNADNEYFVHTEPNVVKTDWFFFEKKKAAEKSAEELRVQELEQELQILQQEHDDLKKQNQFLKQSNEIYIAKIRTESQLQEDIQKLSIHIYYLYKAMEQEKNKFKFLRRSEAMKTVFNQEYEASVRGLKFSQAFMQEMKQLNDFMKNPQFDGDDEIIQDRVQYTSQQIGL
jgi:predicted RNase H-like nuclease (RuvC/YqgF family)